MPTQLRDCFKKCDLHIHSSSCYSRKFSKSTLIEALSNSDLNVISISDHNICDVSLFHELQDALSPLGKVLLPGVEVNVRLSDNTIKYNNLRSFAYFCGTLQASSAF